MRQQPSDVRIYTGRGGGTAVLQCPCLNVILVWYPHCISTSALSAVLVFCKPEFVVLSRLDSRHACVPDFRSTEAVSWTFLTLASDATVDGVDGVVKSKVLSNYTHQPREQSEPTKNTTPPYSGIRLANEGTFENCTRNHGTRIPS